MFGDNRPPSGHHQGWVGVPLRMDTSQLRHSCQCVYVYTCACKRMHVFSVHVLLHSQVRLQTQQPGQVQFKGTLDCFMKTVRHEVRDDCVFHVLWYALALCLTCDHSIHSGGCCLAP